MTATTMALFDELFELSGRIGNDSIAAAQLLAEDFLGVAVAGSQKPEGKIIYGYVTDSGRTGPCNVACRPETFDAASAALVVGTSGYSIGLTDTHSRSITHPGPSIVPVALAVSQITGASGADMLRAIVLGCEPVVRIGAVVNPSHRARGYHPKATCNVFGAAIAAGNLLSLDNDKLANALGLAGSMSGGLYEFRHEGSMLMAFHSGWPAHNWIVVAQLAAKGFTGPSTVLEGPEGFLRAFSDEIHPELLSVNVDRPGIQKIGLRPYNACRYGHSGIDALRLIARKSGPINPDDVAHVTVATHRTAVEQETEATSVVGARLSTKFTVAYAIAHGPKLSEVDDADLSDLTVKALIDLTDVVEDPQLTAAFPEKWACRVTVRLTDGSTFEEQVDVPKGEQENPMTSDEVSEKFHRLTDPVLGKDKARALENEFHTLPGAPDVSRLGAMFSGAASAPLTE